MPASYDGEKVALVALDGEWSQGLAFTKPHVGRV